LADPLDDMLNCCGDEPFKTPYLKEGEELDPAVTEEGRITVKDFGVTWCYNGQTGYAKSPFNMEVLLRSCPALEESWRKNPFVFGLVDGLPVALPLGDLLLGSDADE